MEKKGLLQLRRDQVCPHSVLGGLESVCNLLYFMNPLAPAPDREWTQLPVLVGCSALILISISRKLYDLLRNQETSIFGRKQHKAEKNAEPPVEKEGGPQNRELSGCPFASAEKSASALAILAEFKATKGRVIVLCK